VRISSFAVFALCVAGLSRPAFPSVVPSFQNPETPGYAFSLNSRVWISCNLKAIIVAVGILADANFIERTPTHQIPQGHPAAAGPYASSHGVQYWQLTEKGQEHIAALGAADAACNIAQKQEVCLGS
jgi:hypothetical protein